MDRLKKKNNKQDQKVNITAIHIRKQGNKKETLNFPKEEFIKVMTYYFDENIT